MNGHAKKARFTDTSALACFTRLAFDELADGSEVELQEEWLSTKTIVGRCVGLHWYRSTCANCPRLTAVMTRDALKRPGLRLKWVQTGDFPLICGSAQF